MRAEDLHRAAEVLGEATDVALACHVNPDADAMGSMLGLAHVLEARGVRTIASFPNEPPILPRWARMLPGSERIVAPSAFPEAPPVMVTCDCAAFDRLAMLGPAARRAGQLIWLDHHRSNEGLGSISLNDPDASSTCEVAARLIDAMGAELTDDAAASQYAGKDS